MGQPPYACREDVKNALDVAETARSDAQVDRLLLGASRSIEALTHRRFYPEHGSRVFDWPTDQYSYSWRLWLNQHEVVSVDSIRTGNSPLHPSEYFLEPAASGPPYTRVDINLEAGGAFGTGASGYQHAVQITGLFGYTAETRDAAELVGVVASADTTLTVTDGSTIGVGSLLLVDDEYVQVTGRVMADVGQTVTADLSANSGDVVMRVDDGTAFHEGELLLVDGERMQVVDLTPTAVVVRRRWDGSPLATHTAGATVHASRTLRVARGQLGTLPANHIGGATVRAHVVPELIRELAIAETIVALGREQSGYARTIGAGEGVRAAPGGDLKDLREQVRIAYGRRVRNRAV